MDAHSAEIQKECAQCWFKKVMKYNRDAGQYSWDRETRKYCLHHIFLTCLRAFLSLFACISIVLQHFFCWHFYYVPALFYLHFYFAPALFLRAFLLCSSTFL